MSQEKRRVRLDLNSPAFQRHLFNLEKDQQRAVLTTLKKLLEMTWDQVYRDRGLRWELIASQSGPEGEQIYSLRIGKGFRALAHRDGNWMRFHSLHPDHDSAYQGR